jgi:CO/xanthine dehydrogenase FAD-binding subunit
MNGIIAHARLALLGLGVTPVRANDVEARLVGERAQPDLFAEASRVVAASVAPLDDQHAPSDYRRRLAQVLTLRALEDASARAGALIQ